MACVTNYFLFYNYLVKEISKNSLVMPAEVVERKIYLIRGVRVMLDFDLARLYGVTTKRLNEQLKRNKERFPSDFIFQLNKQEIAFLNRSQFATGSQKHRDPKYLTYVFTEQGVAMLSSVLRSKRAIQVNIMIMRAFVRLRELISTHVELARKIEDLERKYGKHDREILALFEAIKKLLEPPKLKRNREPMGFRERK
jgi:hypothetical protein